MGTKSIKIAEPIEIESPKPRSMVARPTIETVMGPDKGRIIELSSERMTIGRAEENDIVVASEAISRTHAFLGQTAEGWFIRDNGSKNGIQVNGKKVPESWLVDSDVVQVGSFVFKFREPAPLMAPAQPNSEYLPSSPEMGMEGGFESLGTKKKPNRRLLLYTLVFGGLALLYVAQNEGEKSAAKEGETKKEKLARDFDPAKEPPVLEEGDSKKTLVGIEDPALKSAEQEMEKLDWTNASLRESEQFFRKGRREYLNKNYQRAMDQFQTALSLYRGHRLAEKYLRLTMYEAEVKAKKQMEIGIHYFESLQYQRAISYFTDVVGLMQHRPQEAIVGEAERYIGLSKRRLQAAELFP